MTPRTAQLNEVWRVALAREGGEAGATLADTAGPLGRGSLTIYLQSLKEMLRGGQYTRALKNDDAEYFLGLIEHQLGPARLRAALTSMDRHITYYNALGRGELRGAREVHDRWLKRIANHAPPKP